MPPLDDIPKRRSGKSTPGWLMTSVAPFGENQEDAFDQGLVDLGLGDCRLIRVEGAMLPIGFEAVQPSDLPMGSLVECHIAIATAQDRSVGSAGVAWAAAETPEGDQCAIVSTLATNLDYEETESLLKRNLQRRLASRDLEVTAFDVAVDEVTAAQGHHGVAMAALIMPDSLNIGMGSRGRVRGPPTKAAEDTDPSFGSKAPAGPVRNSGTREADAGMDFSL